MCHFLEEHDYFLPVWIRGDQTEIGCQDQKLCLCCKPNQSASSTAMDPDREEADVFSDVDEPQTTEVGEDEVDGGEGEEEEEEEEEDEEEDARIFNTWMQLYRRKEIAAGEENGGGEAEAARAESRGTMEPPVHMRADRRASLPCPVRKHNLRALTTIIN